ncbi:hypothetical protein [Demequina sp.]|uniref:hypothetical protein n=1 Tax=Demequina sp. TaxID=2050685 RepID=UPI003D103347
MPELLERVDVRTRDARINALVGDLVDILKARGGTGPWRDVCQELATTRDMTFGQVQYAVVAAENYRVIRLGDWGKVMTLLRPEGVTMHPRQGA